MTIVARSMVGKTAVVTGAGVGIGRVIAMRCAAAGAHVALVGRNIESLEVTAADIRAAGGAATPIAADVGDPEQVARLAERTAQELGDIDLLVCNSGIAGPTSVLWEIDPADWDETLRVNLTGTFLCCRAFLPSMVARGRGNVVAIGSSTGKRPLFGRTAYSASKLGLIGLVRTLAWETGPHGVTVNVISPGAVAGDRLDRVLDNQAIATGITREEARNEFASSSPLRRLVEPEHVADAVLFLQSDSAASITGEDLNVSAGLVMY
jgi:NAD(P)-dependent dehydrogenase (short-subunit alcohol dehydrogenase family)